MALSYISGMSLTVTPRLGDRREPREALGVFPAVAGSGSDQIQAEGSGEVEQLLLACLAGHLTEEVPRQVVAPLPCGRIPSVEHRAARLAAPRGSGGGAGGRGGCYGAHGGGSLEEGGG